MSEIHPPAHEHDARAVAYLTPPPVDHTGPAHPATLGGAAGGHVPALDGVRGIAVLLVMAFHIIRSPFTALGWSGVDLFFVLSGFLITGILWDTRHRADRARLFYVRRALRILPLYYAVLIAVFVVRPLLGWNHRLDDVALAPEQLWYWTYLCDWRIALGHPRAVTFLTHLWSLSIEEQFYLIWPAILWRCSRHGALTAAGAIAVGALLLRLVLIASGADPSSVYGLLPCRADALAVGAIVALGIRGPGGSRAAERWVMPAALAGLAVTFGLVVFRPGLSFVDVGMTTVGYTALDWAFAGLVFFAVKTGAGVLQWPILRAAGRYSYGLYVFHPLVMWWIVRDAPWLERTALGSATGAIIGSVAVAWLSYRFLESPFLRLKDRWARLGVQASDRAQYQAAA